MKQDDNTDQEIDVDESENTRNSTLLCDTKEDKLDHLQEVLLLGQVRWD